MSTEESGLSNLSPSLLYDLIHDVHKRMDRNHESIKPRLEEMVREVRLSSRSKGYPYIISRSLEIMALSRYYEAILSESRNPESVFFKMPLEWQWDVSVEITDDDLEYIQRENFKRRKLWEKRTTT